MNKIIILLILVTLIISGCTEYGNTSKTATQEIEIKELKERIVEIEENEIYLRNQKREMKEKFEELQEVYSNLFTDATSCYWAIQCEDYPEYCSEYFEEDNSKELRNYYTNLCEGMERDWAEYQSFDIELTGEKE